MGRSEFVTSDTSEGLIDLGDLARGYGFRPPTAGSMRRAAEAATGRSGILLDIGGGTGTHASQWHGDRNTRLVVDPSGEMCRMAAIQPGVDVVQAESQHLPFRDATADLAYFHLSIHYGSHSAAIDEAMRVIKPGSMVEIWTFDPGTMAHSALARWFPRIGELDSQRFPSIESIVADLAAGAHTIEVTRCPETVERTVGSWEVAVRNRFVSTIQLLSLDEIDEGLARFRAEYPRSDETYRYTIEFVRIRATRRPLASTE